MSTQAMPKAAGQGPGAVIPFDRTPEVPPAVTFERWRVWAIVGTLVAAVAVFAALNYFMVPRAMKCVTAEDCRRVARFNTVIVGLRSALQFFVVIVAVFLLLGFAGVNTKGLLLSAGVLGIAVGLGAQSLIRSFIAGLTLLSSDRFSLGDYVQLDVVGVRGDPAGFLGEGGGGGAGVGGGAAGGRVGGGGPEGVRGIVRHFSLTTTVLEDARGARTYVSNGNIALVTNFSQNPQRATVHLFVPHTQDPSRLRQGLEAFMEVLALEDQLKDKVLRPPSVKGVTHAGESSYVVTVTALATPEGNFAVERYLRERLLQFLHHTGFVAAAPLGSMSVAAGSSPAALSGQGHSAAVDADPRAPL
jgi:moderate conductance mechanosensitive channel